MQKIKDYKVDDYVIIKTDDEKSGRRIGKIENFQTQHFVMYHLYFQKIQSEVEKNIIQ